MLKKPKVMVIGFDGGTWNIIKPLVEQGKLPTIEKLMKNGTYGDLETIIPPGTWTGRRSFTTGKNPGKYGVFGWYLVDVEKHSIDLVDSNSYKSNELWDYLGKHELLSGIVNMPTTYPPKRVNGFMVSNVLMDSQNYTYPQEIEKHLKREFGYKLKPDYTFKENKDLTIKACEEVIKQKFEVSKYLLKKYQPDFFNICLFYTDHIQHYYWKYMVNDDPKYGKVIENLWVLIDSEIKNLIDKFTDKETYIILMSDHGFDEVKYAFYVGEWCIKNNYTVLNKNIKFKLLKVLNKIKINTNALTSILINLKLYQLIKRIIPSQYHYKIMRFLPNKNSIIDTSGISFGNIIDFEKSKIIPIAGRLYINKKLIKKVEYDSFLEKLITELKNIKNPFNGTPLYKEVYKREEIHHGKYLKYAPDLITLNNLPNLSYSMAFGSSSIKIWNKNIEWSGAHDPYGIFCISGPGIKKNQEIKDTKIIDLAPTILHLFNIPIPNDIDGRVLTECFKEDSQLTKREIVFQDVEKIEKLKDKIKRLKKEREI